jgi:hypothetical protein
MAQKIPKIVLLVAFSLAVFNFDFSLTGADFSSAGYANRPASFVSQAQAKKKPVKKRKNKVKKKSQKKNAPNFQNPIAISGDDICRKNSEEALKVLFMKDRENFDFVVSHLGKIECAISGSGVYPWENPTRFKVGVATFNAEPIWYAGVLVHESCHIEQFEKSAGKNPERNVSAEEYSGEKAEIDCLGIQLGTLKRLEANQTKIDYVENVAQSRYWLLDIGKRWW